MDFNAGPVDVLVTTKLVMSRHCTLLVYLQALLWACCDIFDMSLVSFL